jgi:hypothetical protein
MRRASRIAITLALVLVWLSAIGFLAAFAEGYVPKTLRQLLLIVFVVGPLFLFGEAILECLLQVIAYGVGRAVLPILTLGRIRAESVGDQLSFSWHGIARLPGGMYVLSHDVTSVFGLVALVLIVVGGYFAYV